MIIFSCQKPYIGETSHSIKVRIQEDMVDIKHNHVHPSTLTKHLDKTKYHIHIEKSKTFTKINHYYNIKIREEIEVEKRPNNLNNKAR